MAYGRRLGSYDSADSITNMPLRLDFQAGVATLDVPVFEGRFAGDEENNPYPAFISEGINGT